MSQAINLRAVRWAYEQDDLSASAKAILMTFAIHADERGYSWPGVDHIASRWGLNRRTVLRQIQSLLVRRMIYRTKKRRGWTGQVKVYRMPKVAYERVTPRPPLERGKGGQKGDQRVTKGGHSVTRIMNNEQLTKDHDDSKARGRSLARDKNKPSSSSISFVESYQNQPPQHHVKWSEFAEWCRRKGGAPTESGFWKWLNGQRPQWRNTVQQNFDGEEGYELNGKFYTCAQADQFGKSNPEVITQFRKARNRDGKIQILPTFGRSHDV